MRTLAFVLAKRSKERYSRTGLVQVPSPATMKWATVKTYNILLVRVLEPIGNKPDGTMLDRQDTHYGTFTIFIWCEASGMVN